MIIIKNDKGEICDYRPCYDVDINGEIENPKVELYVDKIKVQEVAVQTALIYTIIIQVKLTLKESRSSHQGWLPQMVM